jgi:hypothetical protein
MRSLHVLPARDSFAVCAAQLDESFFDEFEAAPVFKASSQIPDDGMPTRPRADGHTHCEMRR